MKSSWRLPYDRVTILVAATTFPLLCLTLLVVFLPSTHFVYHSPELSTAIESLCTLIALGAFYLCYIRSRMTDELRLLFLALAFLILGFYNLVEALLVPLMNNGSNITQDLLIYFWLSARLAAALLLIASLWAGSRKISRRNGVIGVAAVSFLVGALTLLLFTMDTSVLPQLLSPSGWEIVREGRPPEILGDVTTWSGAYQTFISCCFLIAGIGYLVLYRREGRPFWGWLSISFIASFFTQVNFLLYPSVDTSEITTGDFLRLFSRIVLFLGTYAEVTYSYRKLEERNRELTALQEISILGMVSTDIKRILEGITIIIQRVFDAEKVVMLFLDEETQELVAEGPVVGLSDDEVAGLRIPLSEENCLACDVFRRGKVALSNDINDGRMLPRLRKMQDIHTVLIAPLRIANKIIGVIKVINRRDGPFVAEHVRLLSIISSRAAIVIENARLRDELEASAVIAERIRLAREIHDGLAQNLGYLNLKLPEVVGLVENNNGKALEELGSMRQIVQESLTEARQAIVDLQAPVSSKDFLETVSEYAKEFTRTTDVGVNIVSDHDDTGLNPFARAEMARIVQEALNNIRRHADAGRVDITFQRLNGSLRVEISDNGRGFQTKEIFDGHHQRNFGLRSMTGRAKSLGGNLEIISKPGAGTTIRVEIPIEEGKE
ncbi:MAG: GAF domain-containing sensor histidine kinase [Thermoleophilia bacterium]